MGPFAGSGHQALRHGPRAQLLTKSPAHAVLCNAFPVPGQLHAYAGMRRANCVDVAGSSSGLPCLQTAVQASLAGHATGRSRSLRLPVVAIFEKFTERAIKGVMLAQGEAKNLEAKQVGTEHILLGMLAEDSAKLAYLGNGTTLESVRSAVEALVAQGARRADKLQELPFSLNAKRAFEAATTESKRMGLNYIGPEHILLGLLSVQGATARTVVERMGASVEVVKALALRKLKGEHEADAPPAPRKKVAAASSSSREGGRALDDFCKDLCAQAAAGKLDPVIGRDREVARTVQILARRQKNNPILLGEPGVGKTAIAEGLANAIVSRALPGGQPLPAFLEGKRLLQLDVGLLMAGAKERGELESRLKRLLAEVKESGNVILMIDEIHTLVGAGSVGRGSGSGLDIANVFKPALARGALQVIGATTLDEHRKYIEKDAALERRFQPVFVGEPSEAETLAILEGLKERYERHHQCVYDSAALAAAVALSARYVADRQLPDKAIDLIDEAGSRVRIAAHSARRTSDMAQADSAQGIGRAAAAGARRRGAWEQLSHVLDAKDEAVKAGLWEEAVLLRERELEAKARLVGPAAAAPVVPCVSSADIEAVVAAWTGVPVERMSQDDQTRLLHMHHVLAERVIGQDDAVQAVSRAMRRARAGLKDPSRPIGAMLFSGPTGVGKTELTKVLAEHYFGDRDAMVRLDMSEYMERHSVSKLVGAPPGYVGFGEGGKLTEAVRRRPFGIVLLDEVEKAHPDVFNILLQVLEDGRLTDSKGRVVSFKNTLVIMTSNVGSAVIAKGGAQLGFALPGGEEDGGNYSRIRSLVLEELKAYFRPELLNRLDEVVVFRQLGRPQVATIARLVVDETRARLALRDVDLQVTPALMARIVEEGYDEAYGARPLRRAAARLLDDPLADALLRGGLVAGDTAYLDCDASGNVTVSTSAPAPVPKLQSTIVPLTQPITKVEVKDTVHVEA